MKLLIKAYALLLILPAFNIYAEIHKDHVLETNGIKVEFYEASQTGIIRPIDCGYCLQPIYKFHSDLVIIENNKPIELKEFLSDYWNAKHPALYIDLETTEVYQVNY